MRLAEAGVSVDKQRIIRAAGLMRHGDGGVMSKFIGVSDDEAVKGVSGHLGQGIIVGLALLVIAELLIGEDLDCEFGRKNFAHRTLYCLCKALYDDITLKIRACL